MKTQKEKSNKTTAAKERAAREARQQKAPPQSKAKREALDAAAALTRNAIEATAPQTSPEDARKAEVLKAKSLGIELAENEFLTKPENLPEGATAKKVISKNGTRLGQAIYRVERPEDKPKKLSEVQSSKRSSAKAEKSEKERTGKWARQSVGGDRATSLLEKLKKGTREKPILAARQLSDQERAIARKLFAHGQIQRDKFEQGIGYFA